MFHNEKSKKKKVNGHLYRLHSIQRAGLTSPIYDIFSHCQHGEANRTKQLVLIEKSSILPLSHLKQSRKKICQWAFFVFVKNESFVFASRRPIFLHFVVSHLFYGTPFRPKYCSVVYNVCLINICSPPPRPSPSSPTSQSSRWDFASKVTLWSMLSVIQ